MHLLWAMIVGAVAGSLAQLALPGRQPGGLFLTMLLGMAGAIVADFLGIAAHIYGPHARGPGLIASTFGAIVVLGAYRFIVGRRHISAPVRR